VSGLTLQAIREALAAQIAGYMQRDGTVHPYEPGDHVQPAVVIRPADPYVAYFGTMGPNGISDILLDVDIEVAAAQSASAAKAMDDYLSAGTGNTSSVVDAIHSDRTLAGVVGDCVCLTADAPIERDDGVLVATVHVQIIVSKQNAEV
jgi:hypothetical protein